MPMTSFRKVYDAFFNKMEEDTNFFNYFDLNEQQAMTLAAERAHTYLMEAISIIELKKEVDDTADFCDYDDELLAFNWDLSRAEINLLACLMYEQEYKRQMSRLKAFEMQHVPSTLTTFSPANERKTIRQVLSDLHEENMTMLDDYLSKDRVTRKFKTMDYDSMSEDDS